MMAAKKVKKHQHVVPRTYLRGWADQDDQIAVLDRGSVATAEFSVSNAAVRKRFYNFADAAGAETDAVEEWLGKHIEAPIGATLKALRAGAAVGDVDKVTVVNFTVAQLVRTPTVFAYMDHFDDHLGPLMLLMEAAKQADINLLDIGDDGCDRLLEQARLVWAGQDARDARASKLRTMVRKLDEISTQVSSWHWSVLASQDPVLVSGDAPVATLNPTGYHWAGLIPEGSPLWMPLSPTHLLVADPVKPLVAQSVLNAELVRVVTGALARQADHALFNQPGASWPAGLVFPGVKPSLPVPRVTWSKPGGPPTFPTTYPPVASAAVEALLKNLGAVNTVA
jgi:hypothetical protein